ncbi:MAG: hypothetical protein CL445_01920 [Acidimicrobiaceae bacterium]|nr:hypothetical protein [Acidimicrobiaceae bacterium]
MCCLSVKGDDVPRSTYRVNLKHGHAIIDGSDDAASSVLEIAFRVVPQTVKAVDVEVSKRQLGGIGKPLDLAKARIETIGGAPKRRLWLDVEMAGEIHHCEQKITDL